MSVTVNYNIEETRLDELIAAGYTTLKLYYASSPDGAFADSGATHTPALLATSNTSGPPHGFTFIYSGGNPAMWFKVVAYDGASTSSLTDADMFHGGGGTTLQRLRQLTGKLMNSLYTGTTTSAGSTTSAVCSHPRFTRRRDDYFGGGGSGEDGWLFNDLTNGDWSEVSDFVGSTGTFTLSPAKTSVDSGASFEVMNRWTPEDFRDAINWAIVNTYPVLSKPIIDTSIQTADNTWRYQIPNNIRILNKVEIGTVGINDTETSMAKKWMPWRSVGYTPIDDGLARYIEFKREPPFSDDIGGYVLRLTGTTNLAQLYNDTDYVEIIEPQIELIIYMAAHRLYALLPNNGASSDIDRWKDQSNYYMALYNEFKKNFGSRRKSKKWWQHDAKWVIR